MKDLYKKPWFWVVVFGLIILFSVTAYFILRNPSSTPPVNPNVPTPPKKDGINIGDTVSNIFNNLFGAKCDKNNPGYDVNGIPKEKCGKNFDECDPKKCDPQRTGWNDCGIPDNNCY